jgi:hypothetical protein
LKQSAVRRNREMQLENEANFLEKTYKLPYSRVSRRRLLQILGYGAAYSAGASIFAACGDSSPPQPNGNSTPVPAGTIVSNPGATRQISPYFLGYNNVPGHRPSWSEPDAVQAALKLKPGTLRYPGGTVANYWNWRNGWFLPGAPAGFVNAHYTPYTLEDLQIAVRATGTLPIFVLNMLTSDLNSQLEMLRTAQQMDVPVELVELGNEFYLSHPDDYVTKFPTGRDYGTTATSWIEALRAQFPHIKIAAVGGVPSDPSAKDRKATWNQDLLTSLKGANALTMHPYVSVPMEGNAADVSTLKQVVDSRWQNFESQIQALPPPLHVWISEYNFVDPKQKIFRTWADGIMAAEMSLNFLRENRVELICFYDMIGKTGNEAIFYDLSDQGSGNSGLDQYALTAAGWSMSLLGNALHGMTSAQQLSFGSDSAPNGWMFTDGTTRTAFITNSSPNSFTWTNISMVPGIKQYQQYSSDPSVLVTGSSSLTMNNGALGSQLVLPAYSVTQLT